MDLLGTIFWLVMLLQAAFIRFGGDEKIQDRLTRDPAFAAKRSRLQRWFRIWYSIPWLVMGCGQVVGGVPSFWHFLRPQEPNPYIVAFWATIVFLAAWFAGWVFLRGGAATLADQRLVRGYAFGRRKDLDATEVKLATVLTLAGTLVGIVLMVT